MKKAIGVLVAIVALMALTASPALAQETDPDEINCFPLLSSLVCHIPVTVPVGPFEFNGPFVVIEEVFSEGP